MTADELRRVLKRWVELDRHIVEGIALGAKFDGFEDVVEADRRSARRPRPGAVAGALPAGAASCSRHG